MKQKPRREPFARLQWSGREENLPNPASLSLVSEVPSLQTNPTAPPPSGQLIRGDNLGVMAALVNHLAGKIDLIYADPPFLSGNAYAARIGHGEDSRKPSQWKTTHGYNDNWQDGGSYLNMLLPRLQLMYQLLAPRGTLYLHLDWHASAYARVLLDEIFGPDRLLNEIVWAYHGPSPIRRAFNRKHDTILVYTKSTDYTFNADDVRVAYAESTKKTFASSPKAGFGKIPDLERGKVPEDWWYFPVVARMHKERTGYPTQKPESLMERIILASSNPGNLVADFFCGSGTTPIIAARLERSWVACDLSPLAISTAYRRLLLEDPRPGFTLWDDGELDHQDALQLKIEYHQSGPGLELKLSEVGQADCAKGSIAGSIAYWEVDWEYDGEVFRSQSSGVRPWRSEQIDLRQEHTYPSEESHQVAVRVVDSLGRVGLTCLSV